MVSDGTLDGGASSQRLGTPIHTALVSSEMIPCACLAKSFTVWPLKKFCKYQDSYPPSRGPGDRVTSAPWRWSSFSKLVSAGLGLGYAVSSLGDGG